jgi:hypothetical protein
VQVAQIGESAALVGAASLWGRVLGVEYRVSGS